MPITRLTPKDPQTVSVDVVGNVATDTCEIISFGDWSSASITVPSGSSLTTLTFYGCSTRTGTFVPAYDSAATPAAVTLTVAASRGYPLPVALFPWAYLKIVGNAAGSVIIGPKG